MSTRLNKRQNSDKNLEECCNYLGFYFKKTTNLLYYCMVKKGLPALDGHFAKILADTDTEQFQIHAVTPAINLILGIFA